jgi:hypothetical protein
LRATAEGKIERFWKANRDFPDRWKPLKGRKHCKGYLQINLHLTSGIRGVLVHRLIYLAYNPDFDIWDSSHNNVIDHHDRIRTNNKIENLQRVTIQQNQFNRSEVKGYSYNERTGKYQSQIGLDGKVIYLGQYDTPEEARTAYLDAKEEFHIIR